MAQYIDKSAVVAEIERRKKKNEEWKNSCKGIDSLAASMVIQEDINILSFLDTLEVKEVDVEKESELIANSIMISVQANLYHTNVYDYEKRCYKHSDLKDAARKGIELSLKAQKGE